MLTKYQTDVDSDTVSNHPTFFFYIYIFLFPMRTRNEYQNKFPLKFKSQHFFFYNRNIILKMR